MKKSYIAAALALTSCMVVGTAAASQSNSVTATFRPDVTLKVNGTAYTVRDTTGVKVSPLIYNGTTYLPCPPWVSCWGRRSPGTTTARP